MRNKLESIIEAGPDGVKMTVDLSTLVDRLVGVIRVQKPINFINKTKFFTPLATFLELL